MCVQLNLQTDIAKTETITNSREHNLHNCGHKLRFIYDGRKMINTTIKYKK